MWVWRERWFVIVCGEFGLITSSEGSEECYLINASWKSWWLPNFEVILQVNGHNCYFFLPNVGFAPFLEFSSNHNQRHFRKLSMAHPSQATPTSMLPLKSKWTLLHSTLLPLSRGVTNQNPPGRKEWRKLYDETGDMKGRNDFKYR